MSKTALREALDRTHAAHEARTAANLNRAIRDLEHWQKQRLARTYRDLADSERYAQATQFFINDLYAPADLAQRDQDFERMYPALVRLLPESVMETVAGALTLQALTLEVDLQTAGLLVASEVHIADMSGTEYAQAYQQGEQRADRTRQLELTLQVGGDLERYVGNPMIYTTLKMTRLPAILAGLGRLQDFLEKGFSAFRSMHGADEFLATIGRREARIIDALMAGEDRPLEAADPPTE